MPLAIELAAARAGVLPLDQILAGLDDRFALLARGDRDLSSTVAWSYEALPPASQELLRLCSTFAGTFSIELANSIAARDVRAALAALVDASLVWFEPGADQAGYRIPETIRAFAASRAGDDGRSGRHADAIAAHVADLAVRLEGPDEGAAVRGIVPMIDDVRAATAWAIEAGDAVRAHRLIEHLGWFAMFRMHAPVFELAQRVVDAFPDRADDGWAAVAGIAALGRSFHEPGEADVDAAAVLEAAPDTMWALFTRSRVALHRGDIQQARTFAAEVQERFPGTVAALYWRGASAAAATYGGDAARVLDEIRAMIRLARERGMPSLIAMGLYGYGEALAARDPAQAMESLRESLEYAARVDARFIWGVASVSLCSLAGRFGDPMEALDPFEDVIGHWHERRAWGFQWTTLRNLMELLARLGAFEDLLVLHAASAVSERAGPSYGEQGERLAAAVSEARAALGPEARSAEERGAMMTDEDAVAFARAAIDRARRASGN